MTLQPLVTQIADSVLPAFDWDDDKKRAYLSWRLCGFSRKESMFHAGVGQSVVVKWRHTDPRFAEIEKENLVELRRNYAREIITLEFTRNLRTAMHKDALILDKSIKYPSKLSKEEHSYLKTLRTLYTPQQMQILENILSAAGTGMPQSYDELVMIMRRVRTNDPTNQTQAPQPSWEERRFEENGNEGPYVESGDSRGEEV